VRCAPSDTSSVLKEPGVRPFDVTGKPMKGWVLVSAEAVAEEPELRDWVGRSREFVRTLPAK
jgi:hypothetical protein